MRRALLIAVASLACSRASEPVVATVSGRKIPASAIAQRGRGVPASRALEGIIRDELLVAEAKRRGLANAPAVEEAVRRALVQELLRQELDDQKLGAALPEAELREYYAKHHDELSPPERVRVLHIRFEDTGPRSRALAEATLRDIAAREKRGERSAFAAAAMKLSQDPRSAQAGGDLQFLSAPELSARIGPPAATAAFALAAPGDKAGPIQTAQGLEVLELVARSPAANRSYDEVVPRIRAELARQKKEKAFEAFVASLRAKADVRVDEAVLAGVRP